MALQVVPPAVACRRSADILKGCRLHWKQWSVLPLGSLGRARPRDSSLCGRGYAHEQQQRRRQRRQRRQCWRPGGQRPSRGPHHRPMPLMTALTAPRDGPDVDHRARGRAHEVPR